MLFSHAPKYKYLHHEVDTFSFISIRAIRVFSKLDFTIDFEALVPVAEKVGIPEFLKGIGKGVESHVAKLESEIGDFQKLLVTRTLRLKKLGIPCQQVTTTNSPLFPVKECVCMHSCVNMSLSFIIIVFSDVFVCSTVTLMTREYHCEV